MKNKRLVLASVLVVSGILLFHSCRTIPKDVVAVKPFDKTKYLGKWYEIARFDYVFEKNMDHVTATYSLRNDGLIKVDNRGYDTKKMKWKESVGKAKFVDSENEAKLKVSFFGPFYAGYNVIAIDDDYKYALVAGKNRDYLWILSRTVSIPDSVKKDYLEKANSLGFATGNLIWVKHDGMPK